MTLEKIEHLVAILSGPEMGKRSDNMIRGISGRMRAQKHNAKTYMSGECDATRKYLTTDYHDHAKNTFGNARDVAEFLKEHYIRYESFPKTDVITSAYHIPRTKAIFRSEIKELEKKRQKIDIHYFGVPSETSTLLKLLEVPYFIATKAVEATGSVFRKHTPRLFDYVATRLYKRKID